MQMTGSHCFPAPPKIHVIGLICLICFITKWCSNCMQGHSNKMCSIFALSPQYPLLLKAGFLCITDRTADVTSILVKILYLISRNLFTLQYTNMSWKTVLDSSVVIGIISSAHSHPTKGCIWQKAWYNKTLLWLSRASKLWLKGKCSDGKNFPHWAWNLQHKRYVLPLEAQSQAAIDTKSNFPAWVGRSTEVKKNQQHTSHVKFSLALLFPIS